MYAIQLLSCDGVFLSGLMFELASKRHEIRTERRDDALMHLKQRQKLDALSLPAYFSKCLSATPCFTPFHWQHAPLAPSPSKTSGENKWPHPFSPLPFSSQFEAVSLRRGSGFLRYQLSDLTHTIPDLLTHKTQPLLDVHASQLFLSTPWSSQKCVKASCFLRGGFFVPHKPLINKVDDSLFQNAVSWPHLIATSQIHEHVLKTLSKPCHDDVK